jgi:hypothetical protein
MCCAKTLRAPQVGRERLIVSLCKGTAGMCVANRRRRAKILLAHKGGRKRPVVTPLEDTIKLRVVTKFRIAVTLLALTD